MNYASRARFLPPTPASSSIEEVSSQPSVSLVISSSVAKKMRMRLRFRKSRSNGGASHENGACDGPHKAGKASDHLVIIDEKSEERFDDDEDDDEEGYVTCEGSDRDTKQQQLYMDLNPRLTNRHLLEEHIKSSLTSFATRKTRTLARSPNYGTSRACVVLDFFALIRHTPETFLAGQRAISKAQLAREGSNVVVTRHLRQSMEKSYKELFVDVTAKLPGFARAILPHLVLYMENCVNFPKNTATLVCVKPKSLRGACAFSETLYAAPHDAAIYERFSIGMPENLAMDYSVTCVDHCKGWRKDPYADTEKGRERPIRGVVYKRFLLDVGSDNVVFRRVRHFMLGKFIEAFVDMLREVDECVYLWNEDEPDGTGGRRPRFESTVSQDVAPDEAKIWPRDGEEFKNSALRLLKEFNEIPSSVLHGGKKERSRSRAASSLFVE